MALSISNLLTLIETEILDNNTGLISPFKLRTVLNEMVNSDLNLISLNNLLGLSDWSASTSYKLGKGVIYGDEIYKSIVVMTTLGTFIPEEWVKIGNAKDEYQLSVTYLVDDALLTGLNTGFYSVQALGITGLDREYPVDGKGSVQVYKGNNSSETIIYYTNYNTLTSFVKNGESNWKELTASGSGGDSGWTNPLPTTNTVGGIVAGTVPNFATSADVFNAIFYTFQIPTISFSTSTSLIEKGTTQIITLTYNINPRDGIIATKELWKNGVFFQTLSNNTGTINETLTTNTNYQIITTYTNTTPVNSSILNITFVAPTYHGVLTSSNINETQIKTLTKRVRNKANDANLNFNPVLQRYVYAYPQSFGALTSIIDQNGFNVTDSYVLTTIAFTLADSRSETYNVYYNNADTTQTNFKQTFNF